MAGRKSRDKGALGERDVVNVLRGWGVPAIRTAPLQAGMGRTKGAADVSIPTLGFEVEVKRRATGWKTIYDDLATADMMTIRADNKALLFVVPESTMRLLLPGYIEALKAAEK